MALVAQNVRIRDYATRLMRQPVFPKILMGRYFYDEVAPPAYGIQGVRLIDRLLLADGRQDTIGSGCFEYPKLDVKTSRRSHAHERVEAEKIDLAVRQVRDARLSHTKEFSLLPARGRRLAGRGQFC